MSIVLAVAVAGLGGGCVAPARTDASYRDKAADTADAVVSAARTALLAARAGTAEDSLAATVSVGIADAEGDAEAARDAFASIQPPDRASDEIRRSLLPTVERAVAIIQMMRIAARRTEGSRLQQLAAPLGAVAARLEGFATRLG